MRDIIARRVKAFTPFRKEKKQEKKKEEGRKGERERERRRGEERTIKEGKSGRRGGGWQEEGIVTVEGRERWAHFVRGGGRLKFQFVFRAN